MQNAKLKQELIRSEFILYCKMQIERGWSDPNSQLLQNADWSEEEEEEKKVAVVAAAAAAAAAASVCAVIFGVVAGTWVSRFWGRD